MKNSGTRCHLEAEAEVFWATRKTLPLKKKAGCLVHCGRKCLVFYNAKARRILRSGALCSCRRDWWALGKVTLITYFTVASSRDGDKGGIIETSSHLCYFLNLLMIFLFRLVILKLFCYNKDCFFLSVVLAS